MLPQLYFFTSVAFALVVWTVVARRYMVPNIRHLSRADALRPLLTLHSFRFFGLAFLIPGVVSPDLPQTFAHAAAYGDFIAALLALLALLALATLPRSPGLVVAWIFNLWGTADILDAFYQGNAGGLAAGQLGAMYIVPTVIVPLLLVTHGLAFWILLRSPAELSARNASVPGGHTEVGLSSRSTMVYTEPYGSVCPDPL